jgi:GT2 family glycosyltransferase
MVDQVADFFSTTDKVKTQQVVKSRGHPCGDIDLSGYLDNESGPVTLVLDLRIAHDRVGSSTDPTLNGHLKYPNNLDQSLNDTAAEKNGNIVLTTTTGHRVWYHLCLLLLVHQADYMVNLSDFYSYRLIGKLTAFLHLQEFSQRKHNVVCSTSAARRSHSSSREKLA